jgi:hypothetical protein
MSAASLRVATSETLARAPDQVLGAFFCLTGAILVYLVLFDQGAALTVVLGATTRGNLLHEFFHDGRHLWNAPCH